MNPPTIHFAVLNARTIEVPSAQIRRQEITAALEEIQARKSELESKVASENSQLESRNQELKSDLRDVLGLHAPVAVRRARRVRELGGNASRQRAVAIGAVAR